MREIRINWRRLLRGSNLSLWSKLWGDSHLLRWWTISILRLGSILRRESNLRHRSKLRWRCKLRGGINLRQGSHWWSDLDLDPTSTSRCW